MVRFGSGVPSHNRSQGLRAGKDLPIHAVNAVIDHRPVCYGQIAVESELRFHGQYQPMIQASRWLLANKPAETRFGHRTTSAAPYRRLCSGETPRSVRHPVFRRERLPDLNSHSSANRGHILYNTLFFLQQGDQLPDILVPVGPDSKRAAGIFNHFS